MSEATRQAGGLAGVLAAHEARWTTHGWDRPYEVIHCVSADCDWSLRQKALMTDEDCYEAHRAHVAAALLDHLRAVAANEGVRPARDYALAEYLAAMKSESTEILKKSSKLG